MGEELVYAELPPDEGLEIYEELVTEMGQPVDKPAQTNGPPPPVPASNRPLPQAPSLPERNPVTPQRPPPIPAKGNKSTFFDQQPSPIKRPAASLPPVPTQPVHAGGEELRVSQAFQIFIQSKKTGTSKSRYSTPWAKRTDTSGKEMEFISLQGSDSNIPFVPPSILVKMPESTEVATGNYLRLFIPPASSSQQPPQRSTAGIEMENSTAAGEDGPELVYDDTINANTEETYDDVVQKPDVIPKPADDFNQDTYDDVNIKPSEETYDDVTVRQEDTYDDVIQKPNKKSAVTEELVYDDVEITPRGSRTSSPTPSGTSEASASLKVKDKKQQKLDKDRAKKREKSVKHFKQFGLKTSDPSIQELVATVSSEKSKDKDVLQIAIGEKVQLVMRDHPKMKQGMWLVEKSDGTMGLAQANIFAEGEAEIYETC